MTPTIIAFLVEAKKATYAGKGPEEAPSRPASHDLRYEKDGLLYLDSYLGGRMFAGQEALWKELKPFWAMNYAGRVLDGRFDGDFLKAALAQASVENPFRGPPQYVQGAFLYRCRTEGDWGWFQGEEGIFLDGFKIYECVFHGGLVE